MKLPTVATLLALVAVACSESAAPATRGSSTSSGSTPQEPDYVFDDGKGTGATWTALYADFFGPSGRASCAGTGASCHATDTSLGGGPSKFVCASEDGCRASMLGPSNLVRVTDSAKPASSFLMKVLRRKDADGVVVGTQPTDPLLVFHADSLARIQTWIADGAK